MDQQNNNPGGYRGGMENNMTERTGVSGAGSSADLPTTQPGAGTANTPSFGASQGSRTGTGGGMQGQGGGSSETERALEETRDTVARTAGPVVAEKMQEAVEETADRMQGKMGEQAKNVASAVKHDAQHAVEDRANQAMNRAAGGLESAAHRVDELADQYGSGSGMKARAGDMAHRAADTMESTARYLRDNDTRALQGDLERMTREKPLQMLLVAVATGWVLGKILR